MAKKYIDAELLKEGLKELDSVIHSEQLVGQSMHPYDCGQLHAINIIKELIDSLQQEQESVAEQFAKIVRANLSEIGNNAQSQFEQLYFEVTGNKMYGGYND